MKNFFMDYSQNSSETEIDLLGLSIFLLKKWRKLIVFFIVGALVGCGISIYKMKTMEVDKIETYLSGLKDEEIDVDTVKIYNEYKTLYESALKRKETSIVLNMDQNNVYMSNLEYFISCEYSRIDEVIGYYSSLINESDNLTAILDASGLNCAKNDIKELITVSCQKIELDNQIISGDNPLDIRSANYYVNITAPSEDVLIKITDEILKIIDGSEVYFKEFVPNFSLVKTGDAISFGYSATVASQRAEFVANGQDLLKKSTELYDNMSDDEKLYYNYNFNKEEFLKEYENGFSVKYPLIGAFALMILAAICYSVEFILDKSIKTEDEIKNSLGLSVIGRIDKSEYKSHIDKMIHKIECIGMANGNTDEYIKSLLNYSEYNSVGVCFDNRCRFATDLANSITKDSEKIKLVGNIAEKEEALTKLKSCDSTVFILCLGKTNKKTLLTYIDVCKRIGKEITGTIVIR